MVPPLTFRITRAGTALDYKHRMAVILSPPGVDCLLQNRAVFRVVFFEVEVTGKLIFISFEVNSFGIVFAQKRAGAPEVFTGVNTALGSIKSLENQEYC